MSEQVRYRSPTIDNVESAARCHMECWREAYTGVIPRERLAALLSIERFRDLWQRMIKEGRLVTIAVDQDSVIGFANAGSAWEPGVDVDVQLFAINVRQSYWGTGVGQRLLDEAIGDREAFLWVFRDNARARAFYVRNGFQPDGAERTEPFLGPVEMRMVRRRVPELVARAVSPRVRPGGRARWPGVRSEPRSRGSDRQRHATDQRATQG